MYVLFILLTLCLMASPRTPPFFSPAFSLPGKPCLTIGQPISLLSTMGAAHIHSVQKDYFFWCYLLDWFFVLSCPFSQQGWLPLAMKPPDASIVLYDFSFPEKFHSYYVTLTCFVYYCWVWAPWRSGIFLLFIVVFPASRRDGALSMHSEAANNSTILDCVKQAESTIYTIVML